jgi:recombination protein RecA
MATVKELMDAQNKASKTTIGAIGLEVGDPERLPSDIFSLDLAIGGGMPLGRCILIYGMEASMKTTLALKLIASHQRTQPDKVCVFIDIEGHLSQSWATAFGVDWSKLMYVRPSNGEQAVDLCEAMVMADDVGVIVFDSIAALVTQGELDKGAEDVIVGKAGILVNKLYRKIGHAFTHAAQDKHYPMVVFINQIRFKIGVMFGSPETLPGGPSINQFLSSLTLRVSAKDKFIKETDKLPSYKVINVTVKKHKVPILNQNCEYTIALRDIPELGLKLGDSYSWNTILIYLKKLSLLTQATKGWELSALVAGVKTQWATQDELKARYHADHEFASKVRKTIIGRALTEGDPVEGE